MSSPPPSPPQDEEERKQESPREEFTHIPLHPTPPRKRWKERPSTFFWKEALLPPPSSPLLLSNTFLFPLALSITLLLLFLFFFFFRVNSPLEIFLGGGEGEGGPKISPSPCLETFTPPPLSPPASPPLPTTLFDFYGREGNTKRVLSRKNRERKKKHSQGQMEGGGEEEGREGKKSVRKKSIFFPFSFAAVRISL